MLLISRMARTPVTIENARIKAYPRNRRLLIFNFLIDLKTWNIYIINIECHTMIINFHYTRGRDFKNAFLIRGFRWKKDNGLLPGFGY
jgi:hypothetical protein